jgi:hypothetical protein
MRLMIRCASKEKTRIEIGSPFERQCQQGGERLLLFLSEPEVRIVAFSRNHTHELGLHMRPLAWIRRVALPVRGACHGVVCP